MDDTTNKPAFLERVPVMPGMVWAFSIIMSYYQPYIGVPFLLLCGLVSFVGLFISSDGHTVLHEISGIPKGIFETLGRFILWIGKMVDRLFSKNKDNGI